MAATSRNITPPGRFQLICDVRSDSARRIPYWWTWGVWNRRRVTTFYWMPCRRCFESFRVLAWCALVTAFYGRLWRNKRTCWVFARLCALWVISRMFPTGLLLPTSLFSRLITKGFRSLPSNHLLRAEQWWQRRWMARRTL